MTIAQAEICGDFLPPVTALRLLVSLFSPSLPPSIIPRNWEMDAFSNHQPNKSSPAKAAGGSGLQKKQCVQISKEFIVASDIPRKIPVYREEIAILRAFLSEEIRAIIEDVHDSAKGP